MLPDTKYENTQNTPKIKSKIREIDRFVLFCFITLQFHDRNTRKWCLKKVAILFIYHILISQENLQKFLTFFIQVSIELVNHDYCA